MDDVHVEEELIAYLDDELEATERARVEAHLARCPTCASALAELRALSHDLGATFNVALSSVRLSRDADARIRDVLRGRLERPRWYWAFWQRRGLWAQAVMALLFIFFSLNTYQVLTLPPAPPPQEILVFGQERFAPGTEAALRVIVRSLGAVPVAGAEIAVHLRPSAGPSYVVYEGVTNAAGSADVSFTVPDALTGKTDLVVETHSAAGESSIVQPIHIARTYKIYLTGDKSAYRPGQTLHARALVLDAVDYQPVSAQELSFALLDGQGKRIAHNTVTLSEFGIAGWDVVVPATASLGTYTLRATLGDTTSERALTVDTYSLPAFRVTLETARAFYIAGETVQGTVEAAYFFGKPVVKGWVTLHGPGGILASGETDTAGRFAFSFVLPAEVPPAADTLFDVDVAVVDAAARRVGLRYQIPVAPQPILIKAVPESGLLKPGVENALFVMTAYPDGTPAESTLTVTINGREYSATTAYGLAELHFVPTAESATLDIVARDASGAEGQTQVVLRTDRAANVVLLRAEQALYTVGDTLRLEALVAGEAQTVYLDVIHARQMVAARSAPVVNGRATFALDLDNTLIGALTLRAYIVAADGSMATDTRLVVVDAPNRVAVDIAADRTTYYPGETAHFTIQTGRQTDGKVTPVEAALGIAVVDSSVFALDTLPPDFARAYFLLERTMPGQREGADLLAATPEVRAARDMAARAAWAGAPSAGFEWRATAALKKPVDKAASARQALLGRLALMLALLPPLVTLVVVRGLAPTGVLGRALRRLGWGILGAVILAPLAVAAFVVALVVPLLVRVIFVGLLGLILVLLVVILLHGWRRRDTRVQLVAGCLTVYLLLGGLLVMLTPRGRGLAEGMVAVLVVAFLLLIGALTLLGQGLVLEGRHAVGWVTTAVAILLVFLALTLPALPALTSNLTRMIGNPLLYAGPLTWMAGCASPRATPGPQATVAVEETIAMTTAPSAKPTATPASTPLSLPAEPYPLRHIFPETLYWAPAVLTDERGVMTFDLPLADTITTWRMTVLASTRDGALGAATYDVVVFRDFFVELGVPTEVHVGEPFTITATLYNFLPEAQQIRVSPAPEDWYTLLQGVDRVSVPVNGMVSVPLLLRPDKRGTFLFKVNAAGTQMGDALAVEVTVR